MRRLLPLLLVVAALGCGASTSDAGPERSAAGRAPAAPVDLAAAARRLLAARTAHVVYDLAVEPPRQTPLQFATHAVGDFDFARRNAAYVASTPLGEASRTVVLGARRWTRSLGGGTAGAGNPATGWRRASGPDLSPAGVAPLVPLAAGGARSVRAIGRREYEATVATARVPVAARGYLRAVFGAPSGLAQFSLDGRGRLVGLRLLNTTLLPGHTLAYAYAYSRLGEPLRIRPPR